jgi:hypothetical protein
MKLSLFAIANDGRTSGLKSIDGVDNGLFIKRIQFRMVTVHFLKSFDQRQWSRDTADRFGGNGHRIRKLGRRREFSRSNIEFVGHLQT